MNAKEETDQRSARTDPTNQSRTTAVRSRHHVINTHRIWWRISPVRPPCHTHNEGMLFLLLGVVRLRFLASVCAMVFLELGSLV